MTETSRGPAILVTGGAGYIGAHAAKALAAAGMFPVAFDNLVQGHRRAVQWGPLVVGDVTDAGALETAFRQYAPAAVMHFAAHSNVGESVEAPEKYFHNNVEGTRTLLAAMRRNGVASIVFSSTASVYGSPSVVPIADDCPTDPINPYGESKLRVEQMLADEGREWGLRSAALRYFNAAGADPEARIGEDHRPETHLIPLALSAAKGTGPALTVMGDDYPTPDGTCIRDYIHVDDLADAHVLALRALGERDKMIANLGLGRGFSVREVIAAVEAITGRPVPFKTGPRRAGDPPILVSEPSESLRGLGWSPRYLDIESIIATAWRWQNSGNFGPA